MRTLVAIFTVFLIVYSAYKMSFTWFVNKYEDGMEKKASQWVKNNYSTPQAKYPNSQDLQGLYADSLDRIKISRLQSLLDSSRTSDKSITWWGNSYKDAKEEEILLGLDLQGGINVTMDIELDNLIKSISNNENDVTLKKAIAEANLRKTSSGGVDYISLFSTVYKEQNPGKPLAPLFSSSTRNKLSISANDAEVISYIRSMANDAMVQTKNVISKRIDKFGVSQPNLNLDENKNIITAELAGAKNPERVIKLLSSSANLQFWELYNRSELDNQLTAADKLLAGDTIKATTTKTDTTKVDTTGSIKDLKELNKNQTANNTQDAANPILRYIMGFYPDKNGQPQRDEKGNIIYSSNIGYVSIKDTAKFNSYLNDPRFIAQFPSNVKFLYGKQQTGDNGKRIDVLELYALKTVPGQEKAKIEGDVIIDANPTITPTGEVIVEMDMNNQGANTWAKMTKDNIGKHIAIVLDDVVYSAPVVQNEISGGRSQITIGSGKNSDLAVLESKDLSAILKSGKMKAVPKIVQSQVVGPTLGKQALKGGSWAFIISFIVIFALMLVYYNTAGWVANIALILNLLFTLGFLSALGFTLTAPGIAGLVLTIGMAVDTNVIIFERIKEELTKGKSYQAAVNDGYRRSLPPVLDAHVTTLLTAFILLYFGLGPVKGFATTQILGIILSLFCGIIVSRLVTDFWTNKQRHFNYFTNVSKRVFKHASFKFIEYRKVAYMISLVVLVLGIGAVINGFKLGVEFKGGRSYVVNFHKPVNADEVRKDLETALNGTPSVKTYGSNSKLDIVTDYKVNESGEGAEQAVRLKLFEGLKKYLPDNATAAEFATTKYVEGTNAVAPTISDDLKSGAKWATIWSLLIITLYIFIRFRDWRYSLGTIVALLHDVFVTLAVFSFFKNIVPFPLELDQHFIAAVLTVIGFSMNDTVIVFDRVREYSRTMKGASKAEIINKAINDTLSRTIMTSLTVFLTILILFLVGGEVTKGFAFAMLIGVITGTYSSIFVAAPILVDVAKSKPLGEADDKKEAESKISTVPKTATAKS